AGRRRHARSRLRERTRDPALGPLRSDTDRPVRGAGDLARRRPRILARERIAAMPGERILTIDFTARSRFGVVDGYRLVAELIPKFGNVLLLKDQTIVAAAKQFGPAKNKQRAILVGGRYAPPPPRPARVKPPDRAETQPPDGLSVLDAARAHAALRL